MIKASTKPINELDLDAQLEETQKLKQCILDFSNRLQKAQERLLEDDVNKKIKATFMSTQKLPVRHYRRNNSHNPETFTAAGCHFSTTENLKEKITDDCLQKKPENPTALLSNVNKDNRHSRKSSETFDNPQEKFNSLQLPISPSLAYRYFKYLLSPFEQGEVLEYNEIYFLGLSAEKIKNYSVSCNYGYDDERGDYKVVPNDHIGYRFEVLETLGKGSFGQVVKVFDHKCKESLALKIIRNKNRFHEQAEVEVKLLKSLLDCDKANKYNVVHIKDTLVFRGHVCILFEMLGQSLYDVIKANNFKGLNIRYIKRYAYQLLQSLYLLSKMRIIHCDLKPENILLVESSKSNIKVIDFGSSCYKHSKIYTYIQSRFYRAPEVILGLDYSEAIDIWSLGCILIELYTGHPAFPGENEADLLSCIMELLNTPPQNMIESSTRRFMFFTSKNEPRIVPNSKGKKKVPGAKNISDLLQGADLELIDIVESNL
jgi:dual specificity tyrosine-phosphorylation-regulated kinase 2/3/4